MLKGYIRLKNGKMVDFELEDNKFESHLKLYSVKILIL